jgi:hypothetical protein
MSHIRVANKQNSHPEWKTIGVKVRISELSMLNRQLDRLNYVTLGDLTKDLISGKITRLTDDQQIDVMNTNLQTTGQITGLSGKPYDFYKQIDILILVTILRIGIMSILPIIIQVTLKSIRTYFLETIQMWSYSDSIHTSVHGFCNQSKDLVTTILENTIIER